MPRPAKPKAPKERSLTAIIREITMITADRDARKVRIARDEEAIAKFRARMEELKTELAKAYQRTSARLWINQ